MTLTIKKLENQWDRTEIHRTDSSIYQNFACHKCEAEEQLIQINGIMTTG